MQFSDAYEKILSYDFLDDDTKKHIYLEDGDKHMCRFCGKGEDRLYLINRLMQFLKW